MSTTTLPGDAPSGPSSQHQVLSDKVMQTLQIPTDTPAMQAAWKALASLSSYYTSVPSSSSSRGELGIIDAKSVRTAVEMDALHQAIVFQSHLKALTDQVHQMKLEIQMVRDTASQILHTIDTSTTTTSRTNIDNSNWEDSAQTTQHYLEAEQQLAKSIAHAFARRDQAQVYYSTMVEFLNQYELTVEEGQLLDTFHLQEWISTQDVVLLNRGLEFLQILDKTQDIRIQLMQRLEGKTQNVELDGMGSLHSSESVSTSILRMMKSLISRQEQAYQRLYQSLCSLLTETNTNTNNNNNTRAVLLNEDFYSHPFFAKALSVLHRHVPAYYSHIVDLFANARRSLVTKNFLIALTTGTTAITEGPIKSISAAPLERMAHDPITYIGDMLAHVFQCLSDERDLVRSCLISTTEEERVEDRDNIPERDVHRILNHIVGGVVRPLRGRIHAVLESLTRRSTQEDEEDDNGEDSDEEVNWMRGPMDPNGIIPDGVHSASIRRLACLYSICGLLIFYHEKMKNSLGIQDEMKNNNPTDEVGSLDDSNDQSLIRGLVDCLKEAVDSFSISLKVYTAMLGRPEARTATSLQTSKSYTRHLHELIHSLCVVHNTSPGFAINLGNIFPDDSPIYLSNVCDIIMGASLSSCDLVDDVSELRLLLDELALTGVSSEHISPWHDKLSEKERTLIESLISKETILVLDHVGLGDIVKALKSPADDENFSPQYTALSPQRVQTALTRFYNALRSSPIPAYEEQIKDFKLRKYARCKIADGVIEAYTRLYSFMTDHMRDSEFQVYTPEQVRSLLAI